MSLSASDRDLILEARRTLALLNAQAEDMKQRFETHATSTSWYLQQNRDGVYPSAAILAAKAQCLLTIATVQASAKPTIINEGPRRR